MNCNRIFLFFFIINIDHTPLDWRMQKQLRCHIGNSGCQTESYANDIVLFRAPTLKLNTLAINPAFMRLSRGIEGSRGCDAESVRTSGEREREREGERKWEGARRDKERVKIVYTHLYPSSQDEGCPVAMVTRWLIGRTTDAGGRCCVGVRAENPSKDSFAAWSIIPREGTARATVIRAMTLAMSYNLEKTTSRHGEARVLFSLRSSTFHFQNRA